MPYHCRKAIGEHGLQLLFIAGVQAIDGLLQPKIRLGGRQHLTDVVSNGGAIPDHQKYLTASTAAERYPSATPPSTSLGQWASSTYRRHAQAMARVQKVGAAAG
jgi:hypothetical protein